MNLLILMETKCYKISEKNVYTKNTTAYMIKLEYF